MINWRWLSFGQLDTSQLYEVLRLRQDVFVLEQRCLYRDADGVDPACIHGLGRSASGELVAYARVVPPSQAGGDVRIGRVIVAAGSRGTGLGWTLMREAILQARTRHPGEAVAVSAQAYLERFYHQLGFERVSDNYDDFGILHCDMKLRAD